MVPDDQGGRPTEVPTSRSFSETEAAQITAAVLAAPLRPGHTSADNKLLKTHYTELRPLRPDDPLATEWETYRREVGRLLDEGQEGKFVLIKGNEIVGSWLTFEEALAVGYRRFPLEPLLIHQVHEHEPLLRIG